MSKLNFMERLLDEVAVEWKALWEVTIWDKKFNAVSREKQPRVINYTYLLAVDLFKLEQENGDVFLLSTGERTGWTTEKLAGKNLREGEVVTIPWGKSRPVKDILKYYKGRFVTADNRIATSNNTDKLLNKFLYYWMMSQADIIDTFYRGSGIQHPSMAAVLDMKIPIPPLHVQTEIVRILDTFTELTTKLTIELTAEFTARKKQYNYYRDKLLSFEEKGVAWKALGEIGEFIRGKRFTKADYVEKGISAIHYGEIYTRYGVSAAHALSQVRSDMAGSLRYAEPSDVIITGVGETVEDVGKAVAWMGSEKVAIHDDSYAFRHSMNPKFISYAMQTAAFIDEKAKYVSRGKVNRLSINGVSKVRIPIPYPDDDKRSLTEQARIVEILDKFDSLTNSIIKGLPREIELRQKQYEYYRDLLLSFPKPEIAV
ncbi:restriction endonuclease subunit S [Pseudomonas chlororaphis]|uniref:restriction endonuclease subunit S n=1 Tax=Pseudomonas chlororaphis TaxID=587753 RepID=UPI0023672844|nr:restriction endonuclease subunit S [Pseudomonas chlororaphis]WDH25429.1 restriction endonuclease subunit S [Pseudomonas chlororaphis]